jgi:hypothetical protein
MMIDLDDLLPDWAAWSIDKPAECWEFRGWLRDLAPTPLPAESLPPPLSADPPPVKRRRHKVVTLAGALKQAERAGQLVSAAEIYPDHVILKLGRPDAPGAAAGEVNEWDLDLGTHTPEIRQ